MVSGDGLRAVGKFAVKVGAIARLAGERRLRQRQTETVVPLVPEVDDGNRERLESTGRKEEPEIHPEEDSAVDWSGDKWKSRAKTAAVLTAGAVVLVGGHELAKRSNIKNAARVLYSAGKGHLFSENNLEGTKSKLAKGLKETANVVIPAVELGAVGAGAGVAGITVLLHREITHKSIKTNKWVRRLIEFEQKTLGVNRPDEWGKVHRHHHRWTDGKALRFIQAARAIEWIQQEKVAGRTVDVEIPTHFKNFDPKVKEFPADRVIQIGRLAEEEVIERMGDAYERPKNYTQDQLREILYPQERDYYPDQVLKKGPDEYTSDEIVDHLTSDPHSPFYERGPNPVKVTFKKNPTRYGARKDFLHLRPEFADPDLLTEQDKLPREERIEPKKWPYVVAGFAIPTAAILLTRGKYEPKDIVLAALGGSMANGVRAGLEVKGGDLVNAWGHSGSGRNIFRALFGRTFEIEVNERGTIAKNSAGTGIGGMMSSYGTLGEGGMQENHHLRPDLDWFSLADSTVQRVIDDPWGAGLHLLTLSGLPIVEPGEGFSLEPGERRPDIPHEAMDLITQTRREQREKDIAAKSS